MIWEPEIEAVFGSPVAHFEKLQGGDLSEVFAVTLEDGQRMAAKVARLTGTEARMLQAMGMSRAKVPQVLHHGGTLLCLEWLTETPPNGDAWQSLGVGLARLHEQEASAYGWLEDYTFGPLDIDNGARDDWPTFWAEARLACHLPHLPPDLAARIEALAADLPNRLPKSPAPALLHGDLWTGNVLFSGDDAYLIDPACYHGDAEVDLAMLTLFGTPDPRFWQGYGPVAPGIEDRRPLYQLWPALVHMRLFGEGYQPMVTGLLDKVGA